MCVCKYWNICYSYYAFVITYMHIWVSFMYIHDCISFLWLRGNCSHVCTHVLYRAYDCFRNRVDWLTFFLLLCKKYAYFCIYLFMFYECLHVWPHLYMFLWAGISMLIATYTYVCLFLYICFYCTYVLMYMCLFCFSLCR